MIIGKGCKMDKNLLEKQVTEKTKEFRTEYLQMSIGEIVNLYKDDELIINPDFQRYFRWNNSQKSRLIESILLGIPIPPIFVYQNEDAEWEVVDGLQRTSTIFEFMGYLKDENNKLKEPSRLESTEMLPALNDITWKKLPLDLRLIIKRTPFSIVIIKRESHKEAKFEVFQRLNTYGSFLSPQEFRNCLLIMINKPFYVWLDKLSKDKNFINCLSLSEKLLDERYDMELILRYLIFPKYKFSQKEVSEFLTDSLKIIADKNNDKFDMDDEEIRFRKTFKLLNNVLGERVFRKYDKQEFKGKFLESAYECISIGLSQNIEGYSTEQDKNILYKKIKNLWQQDEFTKNMGSGSNTKIRVPKIVPFGVKYFKNE